jgi:hypothetical protein
MNDYGEPKTFTLDYGQMNVLFELLEEAFKTDKDKRLERLRALRNQLYGYLSLSETRRREPAGSAGANAPSVRVVPFFITQQASSSRVLDIHNLFAQLMMFTEHRLQRVYGR